MEKKDKNNVPRLFWGNQPVAQTRGQLLDSNTERAIDPVKTQDDIKQTPLTLPEGFSWYEVDIDNPEELESVYSLLRDHYVEDDDNMFRFDYSKDFLQWALKPPGWKREWHLSVRSDKGKKPFLGFITAIPATICVQFQPHKMVEINFLCIHSKLRKHRLAPVLIREITRRVNVNNIFQAVYTAGVTLPTPFASCQYYHRSLNPKKLIDVRFSYLKKNMTLARTIKLYKLPDTTTIPGLRPLKKEDCAQACQLLNDYLKKFKLYMQFDLEDFEHWFSVKEGVMECYVVEDPETHKITDMASFYSLPSSILNHPRHQTLNAAYSWYIVSTKTPLPVLMKDILTIACQKGFDVFNCLEIHDNKNFLEELKFGPGDGHLKYYLYNWLTKPMEPNEVGLVLL